MKQRIPQFMSVVAAFLVAAGCQSAGPAGGGGTEYVFIGSGGGGDVGRVTTYSLNRTTGDLTQIDRQEVGGLASYIAQNPRLPVFYVTSERGGNMQWIRVDPRTGMITPAGSHTSNGNPVYASVDRTGSRLLAVNYGQGTTDVFPLDPTTGDISGEPVNVETGRNTHSAIFHPTNGNVYVASVADNHIAQYAFRDGGLQPLSPPTVAQEGGPRHITLHPNGNFAYAVFGNTDGVAMFSVGANGTLSPMGTVRRLPPELSAEAGTHMGSDIHVTPSGRFAYSANRGQNNTLTVYSVGADGRLTPIGHESTMGSTPRTFAIDPDGELVIVGNQDSQTVAVFRINQTTGALTHLHTEEIGVSPWFVGVFRLPG